MLKSVIFLLFISISIGQINGQVRLDQGPINSTMINASATYDVPMGDLSDRSLRDLWVMLPCTLAGWFLLMGVGRSLDALTLGERTARSMGINMNFTSWRIFIAVSLCVGAAVSTTGMIGFIGLVVPHLLRPLADHQPGKLLPLAALGGAMMLLVADIGVRLIALHGTLPAPLKVGVLTALVGAPFFLVLILRSRRNYLR